MAALAFIFFMVLGYVFGSICSAVIVSRIFSLPDPRISGSRNPGATNVLRLAGKKYAAIVLIADMLKGLLPVLLAKAFDVSPITVSFTCLATVLGHMYPVFFGFHGGKGVATAIGSLLGLHFILGVMVIATWLLIANFTRYSSLASIASMALAPLYALLTIGRLDIFPPLFFIALFILYKHRNNITRLIDGEEPKIKFNRSSLNEEINATLTEAIRESQIEQEEEATLLPPDEAKEKLAPILKESEPPKELPPATEAEEKRPSKPKRRKKRTEAGGTRVKGEENK
ncbi:glycerol-3-phosphate 1-O-acyltransferase PlsY [Legionella maceachernii]|uniref:Glycerol-3-phosphate acyltransferase n=1 Tax=Legionella maceachernii TaxID=466 RepID=A0A0W0VWG3_9GAMM|nr:glycerol-3-phosphate 1-O-acyltransferase PlsY [Legionella maceachernii]KTD23958.1 transmembrane protein [Legionella maceachernii]SKA18994.1 acyl-phosphate glycerol-3-phosphate acyltransferase [Legionella maceachernii]SUP04449.1 G3P acyltransferase [Legionella maceachernii]